MVFDSTLKSLEVILGGAIVTNQLTWATSWVDIDQTTFGASSVQETDGLTNSAVAVTIIAAPSAGKSRQVKFLSVYNGDTVPTLVTIRINNSGVFRTVFQATLAVGDTVYYA